MILTTLAIGVVGTAAFVVLQLRRRHPLLDVRVFADRGFGVAAFTVFMAFAAVFGLAPAIVEQAYVTPWAAVTTDRTLLVAWFGLHAEAVTDPTLAATAICLVDRFRALVARLIDDLLARGRRLAVDRRFAGGARPGVHAGPGPGLRERGETPDLLAAIRDSQAWLASVTVPPARG